MNGPHLRKRSWVKPLCIAVFVVLAAAAAWVTFVLPDTVQDTGQTASSAQTSQSAPLPQSARPDGSSMSAPPPAATPSGERQNSTEIRRTVTDPPPPPPSEASGSSSAPATGDPARERAESARRDALKLQAALENAGAPDWAGRPFETSWPAAMESAGKANKAYEAGDYAAAATLYDEAAGRFRQIRQNRPRRLKQALEQGDAALARMDTISAEESYRAALSVDGDNDAANNGLDRVRNLRNAIALTRNAESLLDDGNDEEALKLFNEAKSAYPEYEPARLGASRAAFQISDRKFRAYMSTAIAALDRKRFLESQKALDKAERLRPADAGVRDLRIRLEAARKSHALQILQATARRFEKDEAWAKAVEQYRRALKIDPNYGFAVAGLARAEKLAAIHSRIDYYLTHPERLQSTALLHNAEALLAAANAVTPSGKLLTGKREKLAKLVAAASTPVPVTIVSDGKTAVTVYRVARFGRLTERHVELVPGDYTAVGSRDGYRDVRVTFKVPMRSAGLTVTVRCKEPI